MSLRRKAVCYVMRKVTSEPASTDSPMVSRSGFGESSVPQNLGMGQRDRLDRKILRMGRRLQIIPRALARYAPLL
jgi:hypothetical protein